MSLPQNPISSNRIKTPAPYQDGQEIDFDRANINPTESRNHYHLPRLFALIIGINNYQSKEFPRLRGAVPDGKEFQNFLIKRLRVPEHQMCTLFDEKATRSAIIQAFKTLSKDHRIEEGDPIFIFYAGHGGQKTPHPDWEEPNGKIEVIIPYDCTDDSDSQTPAPGFIPSIPDITIAALINEIAREKGNNITVVFDSCHSASGTRSGGDNSSTRVRSVVLGDSTFDRNTDRDIWDCHSRGARPRAGSSRRGLKSHILISACSSFEKAVEHENRGRLSVALLKLFDSVSPNRLKYRDILVNIDQIPDQSPQCEGDNQNRLLFDGKVELSGKVYPIKFESNTSEYTLEAGAALGIAIDAEFMLYGNTDKMSKELLGTLIVDELMPFSAKMKLLHGSGLILSPPIPDFLALQTPPLPAFWALQTKAGTLPNFFVYIPPEDPFHSLYRESDLEPQHILLVDKPKFAHLKIRTSLPANLLVIEVTDKRVTKYGVNVIADQVKPDPDNVSCILERAAHYRRELYRTNRQRVIAANGNISVGFFQLHSPEVRRFGRTTEEVTPIGPNLCDNNQIIDFVVEEDKPYGICLKNNTVEDLYVNAFFFDNTNFAIAPYYTTHFQGGPYKLESPLKKGSTLTIGYGSGGAEPFTYPITPDHDVDVGFLKIYLSTQAFDLSGIAQAPAFTQTRAHATWRARPIVPTWDTILIPVIQRRRRVNDS